MLKNNKGITIVSLVITIIILMILTGVSLGTGYSVIKNVRIGRIVSSMNLVKSKADIIYEQYQFNGDSLIGAEGNRTYKLQDLKMLDGINLSNYEKELIGNDISEWNWYRWDASIFREQGLDGKILGENGCFYVNYENSKILYSKGTSYKGINYYSMEGLNYIYQEY